METGQSSAGETELGITLTPTWAVAIVCAVFVAISLTMERSIHWLGNWFIRTKRKPLYAALQKIKEEMMILGFISLVLTATSHYIAQICVDSDFYSRQPKPCKPDDDGEKMSGHNLIVRRNMGESSQGVCQQKGMESLVSIASLEQLHRFIFLLGVTHVIYSCFTMLLALVKVYRWRKWEDEVHSDNHDTLAEITKNMTLKRQSTFVLYHTSKPWSKNRILVWVVCFFRQFGQSVTRADYLTLRLGFITNHHTRENYDFHSYMVRTMEDEFKDIVGISVPLWGFTVIYMLFDIEGINFYFWISFIPLVLVILVGAKLQHVIATLALENAGIRGQHVGQSLRPRNELFWFKKPELLLYLIHFIIFQNAFELATFLWTWWQFDYKSCLIEDHKLVYIRLAFGSYVQILCSFSTLPLYALVTQMGSNYKRAIFQESILHSLHAWHKKAKKNVKYYKDHNLDASTTNRVLSRVYSSFKDIQSDYSVEYSSLKDDKSEHSVEFEENESSAHNMEMKDLGDRPNEDNDKGEYNKDGHVSLTVHEEV